MGIITQLISDKAPPCRGTPIYRIPTLKWFQPPRTGALASEGPGLDGQLVEGDFFITTQLETCSFFFGINEHTKILYMLNIYLCLVLCSVFLSLNGSMSILEKWSTDNSNRWLYMDNSSIKWNVHRWDGWWLWLVVGGSVIAILDCQRVPTS